MADGQVFRGVTPGQFARLQQKAHGAGIQISGNSGSAAQFGAEVAWNYSPETQELRLEILQTPFFMKKEDIEARMRALVEQSMRA